MLLAIDSGNTNIVFAVFSDTGDLRGEWRAGTESNRTADELGIWLTQLLEKDGIENGGKQESIGYQAISDKEEKDLFSGYVEILNDPN